MWRRFALAPALLCAAARAQQTIGHVALQDAMLTGTLEVTGGEADVAGRRVDCGKGPHGGVGAEPWRQRLGMLDQQSSCDDGRRRSGSAACLLWIAEPWSYECPWINGTR